MLSSHRFIPRLSLLQLFILLLAALYEIIVKLLLQLQLLLSVMVVYIVELLLLFEKLQFQILCLLTVALEHVFDLSYVLLGHLMTQELVYLLQES